MALEMSSSWMPVEMLSPWMWATVFVAVTSAVTAFVTKEILMRASRSWSLPIVGDLWQIRNQGLCPFLMSNFARFGDPFKLSLFGHTILVMNTPESIRNVLSTAHKCSSFGYPETVNMLLGVARDTAGGSLHHAAFRKLILPLGNPRGGSLSFVNSKAREAVKSWERVGTVNTADEISKFTFSVIMHFAWADIDSSTKVEKIGKEMELLNQGMYVLPINLPQFPWYKALKAKESVYSHIRESLANRRKQGIKYEDFLGGLMGIPNILDDEICSHLVVVLFAGSATTSLLIQWIIKYLYDYPTVRGAIQAEQDGIQEKMTEDNFFQSFSVKAHMPLTAQMIDEVLRIQSLAPIVPRHITKTFEYKGIVIPKGSKVWASTCSLAMNPEFFPNPTMFNPSRFKTPILSDTFMPFGLGPFSCPGTILARSQAAFVVHHLLTNYSWESVGSCEAYSRSRPNQRPTDGLITVQKRII